MEIARHWRLKAQRYRLEGSTCPLCGQLSFPPRPVCPDCAAQPAQIVGRQASGIPIPMAMAGLQAHMDYRLVERVIG